jgi:ATP synthase F1 delta subunit
MHAASRESMQAVQRRFDDTVGEVDTAELSGFADELASLAGLLVEHSVLRKYLAAREDDSAPKVAMIEQLLTGKASRPTIDIARTAAEQRWSLTRDLPEAFERLARLAVLVAAERADKIEDVEDELFRFGRTLDANPHLASLLSQVEQPVEKRIGLLDSVIGNKATSFTADLLRQSVRLLHGHNIVDIVPELAELAAARRGESVAHVVAAAPLNEQQYDRLSNVLSRIYGRTISVQLDVDPEVLGGLQIRIGDEVVDGTIVAKLSKAASQLPE